MFLDVAISVVLLATFFLSNGLHELIFFTHANFLFKYVACYFKHMHLKYQKG